MLKFQGYLYFYVGLILIIFSALNVYFVLTGKLNTIQYFHIPSFDLNAETLTSLGIKNISPNTKLEILPASVNNQFANLFAHLSLMGFLAGIGFKTSSLGSQLLRPIKVNLKSDINSKLD